jgi:hypothetical protein
VGEKDGVPAIIRYIKTKDLTLLFCLIDLIGGGAGI